MQVDLYMAAKLLVGCDMPGAIFLDHPKAMMLVMTLIMLLLLHCFNGYFQVNLGKPVPLRFLPPLVQKRTFGDKWHRYSMGCMSFSNATNNKSLPPTK